MIANETGIDRALADLTLPRLDGGELRFGELRGKRALLFIWGSW